MTRLHAGAKFSDKDYHCPIRNAGNSKIRE